VYLYSASCSASHSRRSGADQIDLPRKDERLSQPGWLTHRGRFTHISGHPSAAGRTKDSESSPVKDQRSTAVPRNHIINAIEMIFYQLI